MIRKKTALCIHWLVLAGLLASLSACGSDQRELQTYIDDVKARPGKGIEPLPEVRPTPKFVYEAGDRRSPFVPDTAEQRVRTNPNAVDGPDPNRTREPLEQEPLDSLKMVGTLSNASGTYGLVRDSEGLVHHVTIGNYMGQNDGRITGITDSEIDLVEIVHDRLGGWIQRPASIGLSD
jgi:type IV pilus assembly protein PilP